jgi:hypothetical protein
MSERIDLEVRSGIRLLADAAGVDTHAAVHVTATGGREASLTAHEAITLASTLLTHSIAQPCCVFRLDFLELPEGAGLSAESARELGMQMLAAALIAPYELAIWEMLRDAGAPEAVRSAFLDSVKVKVAKKAAKK